MRKLTIRKGMLEKEVDYIQNQLREYNLQVAPQKQEYIYKNVHLVLEDKNNQIYGGLIGKIYRACLFIDVLWVSESKRGFGYGRKLIEAAEIIAKKEACTFVHLDTFSFQAPDFYKKNGYEIYGVLDSYSDGIKRFYLKKEL
jgi:GNAT superfamily N-acetyltransferase